MPPANLDKEKTAARTRLNFGQLYRGTVYQVSPNLVSCTVKLENGTMLEDVQIGRAIMSFLLGYQLHGMPTPGTRCEISFGDPPLLTTLIDSNPADGQNTSDISLLTGTAKQPTRKYKTFANDTTKVRRGATPPADLLEGEFQISNALGMALTMLNNLARLSAGQRAKIEVSLINDMVRMVSATFRHFSSTGDQEIYDDGRANDAHHATSYEHERLGRLNAADEKVKVKKNVVDFSSVDAINETGRWRYSRYLGFLGDFVHAFVTDPTKVLGSLAEDAFRSGKANIYIGGDGAILVQSVAEIAFERVSRIQVPIPLKRHEDPKGVLRAEFDKLEKSYLKQWDLGKDPTKMCQVLYQLREQARYLSNFQSLARFHQLADKGEWKVPMETDTPEPSWANKEQDREEANQGLTLFKDTYSTIRQFRDGSILALNGYGTAAALAGYDAQISAPRHLFLESGGDVRITAGQNVLITARRNIEIVSIVGGLRLKARAWLQGLVERGSVYLKSDAFDPTVKDPPDDKTFDDDPDPIVLEHAVLIEATKGRTAVLGSTRATLAATGYADTDDHGIVEMRSQFGTAQVLSGKDVELRARTGLLKFYAAKDFIVVATRALWQLRAQCFDINGKFAWFKNALNVNQVKAERVSAKSSIQGPDRVAQGMNHIDKLGKDGSDPEYAGTDDDTGLRDDYAGQDMTVTDVFDKSHPVWNFGLPEDYRYPDWPFESMSQQRLRSDDDLNAGYGLWTFDSQNKLKHDGPYNGSRLPAPGTGALQQEHDGGQLLHQPAAISVKDLQKQTDLKPKPVQFRYYKKPDGA